MTKNLIGTNSGNLIFSTAAAKLLTTATQSIHVDTFNPGPEDADRINSEYEHYVIPLANAFRPNFVDHLDRLSSCIEKL
ncbi:MAG: polysaccharide pyruvyl transferase family protein, partial [Candidatus Fonsibacter sp.]